jgi:hypothetical protein
VVGIGKMVAELFLSNFRYMECFCDGIVSDSPACHHYCKSPGNQGGDRKPCEIVTNRINESCEL